METRQKSREHAWAPGRYQLRWHATYSPNVKGWGILRTGTLKVAQGWRDEINQYYTDRVYEVYDHDTEEVVA